MFEIFTNNIFVAALASGVTSLFTYIFTKRKYESEVDASEIQNLKESLAFYKDVLEENQKLLKVYMQKVDEGMVEIHNLRKAVSDLLAVSCVDNMCKKRKMIEGEEAKKFLNVE